MKNIESLLKVFLVICTAQLFASMEEQQATCANDLNKSLCYRLIEGVEGQSQVQGLIESGDVSAYTILTRNIIKQRINTYTDNLVPGDDGQLSVGPADLFKTTLCDSVDAALIVPNLLGVLGFIDVDYQLCNHVAVSLMSLGHGAGAVWVDLLQLAAQPD